jgi:hypothetical protein
MDFIPFGAGVEGGIGMPDLAGPAGSFRDIEAFRKAVTAGYGTDMAALTGGGALRLQSIEPTLLRTIQEDKHFRLFNKLATSNATATVDEFTIKDAIGGYPGSAFNSELGDIAESQGTYRRQTLQIRYLMTMRKVSVVQQSQKTLVDAIAEEKVDAARELKTSVEWGSFYGDSAIVPEEIDGLGKVIEATADADLIVDAGGNGLSYVAQEVLNLAAAINSYGRFGTATDLFCSMAVQSAEFDQKLDPAFRVGGSRETKMGTPVSGINTSWGPIEMNPDVFIREGDMPWESRGGNFAAVVAAAGITAPAITTQPAATTGGASNKFGAAHAGQYYYGIEAITKSGRSTCTVTNAVAVAAGQKVTIVLTEPSSAAVTGFAIYRSRKNGTNAKTDLREVKRIARVVGGTTSFVDENLDIPGSSRLFLLNMAPGQNAINLRRLLPMTMFPLYPTAQAVRPWAQLLFCALRVAKPKQHGMVKNIVPASAAWKPF